MRDGRIISTQDMHNFDINNILFMLTGLDYKERYPKLEFKPGRERLRIQKLCHSSLHNISFYAREREIVGITGLIGSGGTDLAKCIFGCEHLDSGQIFVDSVPVSIKAPWDAIRKGISFLPEDKITEGIFKCMQVKENISSSCLQKFSRHHIIYEKKEQKIAAAYIKNLNIKAGSLYDDAATLSGGNQQKMMLAKWMLARSNIFIFDEPTRGIDIASKTDVYNVINELVKKKAAVIIISSDLDELIGMCDRIIILKDGEIRTSVSRKHFDKKELLHFATC